MPYSWSIWYTFATITTIGFGDVIAAYAQNWQGCAEQFEDIESEFYHQNNVFWVSKMGFLLVALSAMMATMLVRYDTIVEYFYSPVEKMFGNRRLLENQISVDATEEMDMNSRINSS